MKWSEEVAVGRVMPGTRVRGQSVHSTLHFFTCIYIYIYIYIYVIYICMRQNVTYRAFTKRIHICT